MCRKLQLGLIVVLAVMLACAVTVGCTPDEPDLDLDEGAAANGEEQEAEGSSAERYQGGGMDVWGD